MKTLFEKYMGAAAFFHRPEDGNGAAGAAAPAEAPSVSTPAAPASVPHGSDAPASGEGVAGVTESSDEFSSFGDNDYDEIDLGAEVSPSPEAEPKPAAPPPPASPAPAPAAAPAKQAGEEPKAAAPTGEGAKPVSPPSTVDALMQSIESNAPALQEWLAKNAYALSKEEQDAFEINAVEEVPKLMARVAVANMKSTMAMIKNVVPQLIQAEVNKLSATKERQTEAINEFYSSNPHLNAKDHGALVTKWANAFRAANPKASRKEAIEYVGRAVSFEAGVAPGTPAPQRAAPFAPARPGARQAPTPPPTPHPFEMLGMDIDE
jgi:hypothetical protein